MQKASPTSDGVFAYDERGVWRFMPKEAAEIAYDERGAWNVYAKRSR